MKRGYVKLWRKSLESLIFENEKGWKVWSWCLMKASHTDRTALIGRQKLNIKKGQFIMGSLTAKEQLRMAVSTIWYWLDFLEKEKQVVIKKTNKYSIITIQNWCDYQEVENKSDTNDITNRTQIGTDKNDIRITKNEKNISAKPKSPREWANLRRAEIGKAPLVSKQSPKQKAVFKELSQVDDVIQKHRKLAEAETGADYSFMDEDKNPQARRLIALTIPKVEKRGKTMDDYLEFLKTDEFARKKDFNPLVCYTESMFVNFIIGKKQNGNHTYGG